MPTRQTVEFRILVLHLLAGFVLSNIVQNRKGLTILEMGQFKTNSGLSNSYNFTNPSAKQTKNAEHQMSTTYSEQMSEKSRSSDESIMTFIKLDAGATIRLKCRIRSGPYLVFWNKVGVDYPLTIGTRRFVPDERIQVRFRQPDKWELIIHKANYNDTGVYTCTTSSASVNPGGHVTSTEKRQDSPPLNDMPTSRTDSTGTQNRDYYVSVVEPNITNRFQVDAPATEKEFVGRKVVTLMGPKLVFYGTAVELRCRVSFPSDEAKLNPHISLEWYHQGVRCRPSVRFKIIDYWLDSHLLESRLTISRVTELDAGRWICLERSRLNLIENATGSSQVRQDSSGRPMKYLVEKSRSDGTDLAYDKMEIEVVDLPKPTPMGPPCVHIKSQTTPIPIYPLMDDTGGFRISHVAPRGGVRSTVKRQTWVDARTAFLSASRAKTGNGAQSRQSQIQWIVFLLFKPIINHIELG